ncbi:MAG: ATP-binding protein [Pseudobdellovibrionaceae bacterium]|nr:ATP-binding protein [Pseudobdellovibrionaceae bacterium]
MDLIQSVMTHLLRNSIDHGLEFPEIREAQGKPAQGRITISARPEGSHLQIDLADDGAGLDLDRIRTLAVASSRLHSSQSLSDLALAELIFEDGLSTKAEVTQISGRGVGMSAVRRILKGSSGSIAILLPSEGYDRKHVPIAFRLLLPQDLWQSPGDRRSTAAPQTVKFQRKVL